MPTRKDGDAWSEQGAILRSGKLVSTWDWWSAPWPNSKQFGVVIPTLVPQLVEGSSPAPLVFTWQYTKTPYAGLLRFFRDPAGQVWVAASAPDFAVHERTMLVAPVYLDGGKLIWTIETESGSVSAEMSLEDSGKTLRGVVYQGGETLEMEARQIRNPKDIRFYLASIFTLPDVVWFDQLSTPARAIDVPAYVPTVAFGECRNLVDIL